MKGIFTYNADIEKTAYLNWRMWHGETADNLWTMADSFASATKIMIQAILDNNSDKKADALIFPILFCIDHTIELYLKAILREIETLGGLKPSVYKTHDIKELFENMTGSIKKKEKETSGLGKCLKEVSTYIDELYGLIMDKNAENKKERLKIDFARYPIDTSGNEHFYIHINGNVVVDVENLQARFKGMEDSLKGLFYQYQAELEEKAQSHD